MSETLDIYREWLGVTETARPLNCYQLLRVKIFSDDVAKIRAHYRKMNAHVRKYATGDFAQQSQDLLNELARAMLCLTDVQRKREYDASMGREDTGEGKRRTLEEILLASKTIDQQQLQKARSYADAVGLEVRDALVQQKVATADVVMLAYAESIGLPYMELADIGIDEGLVPKIPALLARQHSCVPVMVDAGQLLMASPNPLVPDVEEELRLRLNMPVRTVLCTAPGIHAIIEKHFPHDAADQPAAAPAGTSQAASKPKKAPKPAKPKKERRALSSDDKIKRRLMTSVLAFNITAIVLMFFVLVPLKGGMHLMGFIDFAAALGGAVLAAGAAFGVTSWLDK